MWTTQHTTTNLRPIRRHSSERMQNFEWCTKDRFHSNVRTVWADNNNATLLGSQSLHSVFHFINYNTFLTLEANKDIKLTQATIEDSKFITFLSWANWMVANYVLDTFHFICHNRIDSSVSKNGVRFSRLERENLNGIGRKLNKRFVNKWKKEETVSSQCADCRLHSYYDVIIIYVFD